MYLSMNCLPEYCLSNFKKFTANEKHVTRVCSTDVLLIMISGTLFFNENGIPVEIRAGEYYIQRRNILQEGKIPSDDAFYYYIHFLGDYSSDPSGIALRGKINTESVMPLINKLNELNLKISNQLEKYSAFYEILIFLKKQKEKTSDSLLIERIISDTNRNISVNRSLNEIAEHYGYSKNQLIRIFRKETGKTPYKIFTELRINAAKTMLYDSDISSKIIAKECGFGDYVNLYKMFKLYCNCSPTEWRKTNRNAQNPH